MAHHALHSRPAECDVVSDLRRVQCTLATGRCVVRFVRFHAAVL